jgi:DNA-binding transcriptional MocR family regulator
MPAKSRPRPAAGPDQTLVEQCVRWAQQRIEQRTLVPGMRMPSIRNFARERRVSKFTAVEAYSRLVSLGCLEARAGSGFYVLPPRARRTQAGKPPKGRDIAVDVLWLLTHMLQTSGMQQGPGMGSVPPAWLEGSLLATAVRSIARRAPGQWVGSSTPQGFLPLRQQLQLRLAGFEIAAEPEQIVLTTGITHALTLLLGVLVPPGEAVLVGDPSWFAGFGTITAHGARPVGYPYDRRGPDVAAIERLVLQHRPKLLVINSIGHNPTGTSLQRATAERLLALAETHGFMILEDDVYADLCPKDAGVRLASLDRMGRVIYAGSFTKTVAENLRVGFVACAHELAQAVANRKVLTGFTTPEANERVLHSILVSGHYRKHAERLCAKLGAARACTLRDLARLGLTGFNMQPEGLFIWVDTVMDGVSLAAEAAERSLILAPGALFSPLQAPSTRLRINVTRWDAESLRFFESTLGKH